MIDTRFSRIAVTMPPENWFGGFDRRGAEVLLRGLERRFGQTFYQFDTTPFIYGDVRGQRDAVAKLKEYRPEIAISLSNAGYGVSCTIRSGNSSLNVFTDVMNIPLMLLWDHGLLQFPAILLAPLPQHPVASAANAIGRVRETIDHELAFHFAIDSGQVSEMRRIGLLRRADVTVVPALAYDPFIDFGVANGESGYDDDLSFAGNVYLSPQHAAELDDQPIAARCHAEVMAAKCVNLTTPAWTLLARRIAALSDAERKESGLDFDQTYFWHFANRLIALHCNTESRVAILNGIGHDVSFYGAFADPGSVPRMPEFLRRASFKRNADFATELPRVYARSRILVDVTNAAFINACSTKPICCFAAGGFCLFDDKPDARAQLGEGAEQVMYRSADELNAKIEYFLSHERERKALARHLQERIRTRYSFTEEVHESAARVLADAYARGLRGLKVRAARSVRRLLRHQRNLFASSYERPPVPTIRVRGGINLSGVQIFDQWSGARKLSSAPLRIETADGDWGYSALFPISAQAQQAQEGGERWISVTTRTISGRVGIGLLDHDSNLVAERFVEEDDVARTLLFKVPSRGVQGLMFRSGGTASSVAEVSAIALREEATRGTRRKTRAAKPHRLEP